MEILFKKFNNLSVNEYVLIAISLIPIALVSGPLVPEIILNVVNILFLYNLINVKNFNFVKSKFFILFLPFYLYILTRSIFSEDILSSLKSSFFYFRFGIFVLAINFFFFKSSDYIKESFFKIIFFSIIIISIDGVFQYFFGYNFLMMKQEVATRVSGLFGDEMVLGSYVSRFFLLVMGIYYYKNYFKKNFFFNNYFLLLLFTFTILISGERTALIFLSVGLILYYIFIEKKKILFLGLSIICLILIFSDKNLKSRYITHTLDSFIENIYSKNQNENLENKKFKKIVIFNEHYTSHYKSAYAMFKDNIFFGHGPRMYRHLCSDEKYFFEAYLKRQSDLGIKYREKVETGSCSTHPHNIYMQFLAELGLIGFIYLIFIQFKVLQNIYYHNKVNDKFNILVLSSIFICIWPLSPNGNFFNNWLSILLFFLIGIYFLKNNMHMKRK